MEGCDAGDPLMRCDMNKVVKTKQLPDTMRSWLCRKRRRWCCRESEEWKRHKCFHRKSPFIFSFSFFFLSLLSCHKMHHQGHQRIKKREPWNTGSNRWREALLYAAFLFCHPRAFSDRTSPLSKKRFFHFRSTSACAQDILLATDKICYHAEAGKYNLVASAQHDLTVHRIVHALTNNCTVTRLAHAHARS